MKKLLLLFVSVLFSYATFAQQNVIETKESFVDQKVINTYEASSHKDIDTVLMNDYFAYGVGALRGLNGGYGCIGGALWWGVDTPACASVAQGYWMLQSGYNVTDVLLYFGDKTKVSANGSSIDVSVNLIDATSSYSGSTSYTIDCPGTELAKETLDWDDIDTTIFSDPAKWTVATFATPPYVSSDYAVVVDYQGLYPNDDSLRLVSGESGSASGTYGQEYVWFNYLPSSGSSPFWTQLSHVFTSSGSPADYAFAIFPVVSWNIGVQEEFVHGIIMNAYPNPATDVATIDYELESAANDVVIRIIDMSGREVMTLEEGAQSAGTYSKTISVNELTPGAYFYMLSTGSQTLTRKMIVE